MTDQAPDSSTVVEALDVRDLLELTRQVCARRGVALDDLCGRLRSHSVSRARQEVWWLLRHHPERNYSLGDIARLFRRDHSTILAGVRAHGRRLENAVGSGRR
jgi:chromosomal replication initiation ATPase DnaA